MTTEIIPLAKSLMLPADSFVVIGGGVLAALNIRPTEDLDLVVSPQIYQHFQRQKWGIKTKPDDTATLYQDNIEMATDWLGYSLTDLQTDALIIDEVACMSLEKLLTCKRKLHRDKDMVDIQLIQDYLAQQLNQPLISKQY